MEGKKETKNPGEKLFLIGVHKFCFSRKDIMD
jgi:hypothetical protein